MGLQEDIFNYLKITTIFVSAKYIFNFNLLI